MLADNGATAVLEFCWFVVLFGIQLPMKRSPRMVDCGGRSIPGPVRFLCSPDFSTVMAAASKK